MPTYRLHDDAGYTGLLERPAPNLGCGSQCGCLPVNTSLSPKDERKRKPAVPEGVKFAVASPENAPAGLDWRAFSAAYFPGCHRHDLEAVTSYGAYRRARLGEERTSEGADRAEDEAEDATGPTALATWED